MRRNAAQIGNSDPRINTADPQSDFNTTSCVFVGMPRAAPRDRSAISRPQCPAETLTNEAAADAASRVRIFVELHSVKMSCIRLALSGGRFDRK